MTDKNKQVPYIYKCGTQAQLGDIVRYKDREGILFWSKYLQTFEVSVGTGLTFSERSIDDFDFVRRGVIVENPYKENE